MKRTILRYALLAACLLAMMPSASQESPRRKKVAVVLSGGGAKGMAHIGVLKVLEKAGIPIDIITGTSMGSIVGGLYSIGYDAQRLDSMVRVQDWTFLLSDKADMKHQNLKEREKQNTYFLSKSFFFNKDKKLSENGGLINGRNLSALFNKLTTGYTDSVDFNNLPIPFACVATNIVNNTEYVFHRGILAQAMRSSMSIPGAFSPIRIDSMVLVDGGLRNNFPADIARQMGADVVIGVTLQGPPKTADDLRGSASILGQIVDVNCKNKYDANLAITDIPIRVNTKGYSSTSFSHDAIDTLIRRGEEEAMKHWDEIIAMKKNLGLDSTYVAKKITPFRQHQLPDMMKLSSIKFNNIETKDANFIKRKFQINEGDSVNITKLERAISTMNEDLFYSDATYEIEECPDGYALTIQAKEKRTTRMNLGFRFDSEEMAALQANAAMRFHAEIPVTMELTARFGKRMMGRLDAAINPVSFSKMVMSYIYRYNDINVYHEGDKKYNITYNYHAVNLSLLDVSIRNFNFDMGVRWDYYNCNDVLLSGQNNSEGDDKLHDTHFFSYHANMHYNSEDKWNFSSHGAKFQAGYGYYTDNFVNYGSSIGFSEVNAMWRMSFALNNHLTLQPMVYGRMLFGSDIPLFRQNAIGGDWFGSYVDQQMPFAGVGHVEIMDNLFTACQVKLQQRIMDNNYILLRAAAACHSEKAKDILSNRLMTGFQLAYYYDSILGPLGATLGYSSLTKKPYLYINLGFEF